jgi:hypothetical protein
MKRIGLLIVLCLLFLGIFASAGADIYGSLGANSTQDYKVNLQDGAYTVEFAAPDANWQANVTYICYS